MISGNFFLSPVFRVSISWPNELTIWANVIFFHTGYSPIRYFCVSPIGAQKPREEARARCADRCNARAARRGAMRPSRRQRSIAHYCTVTSREITLRIAKGITFIARYKVSRCCAAVEFVEKLYVAFLQMHAHIFKHINIYVRSESRDVRKFPRHFYILL